MTIRGPAFLIITLLGINAWGANVTSPAESPQLFKDLFRNTSSTILRPQTAGLAALLAFTPTLVQGETNRPYLPWINRNGPDRVFEYGNLLGNGAVHGAAALSLYLGGKLFHRNGWAALGSDLFSAQAIADVMSTGLKVALNRTRPDGAPYSFPSGHATVAFASAGVIADRDGLVAGIISEATASYVGLSRLQEDKHYISDVVAGCLLGNYVAYQVVDGSKRLGDISISASPSLGVLGAAVAFRFH